jgi:hypothetical protein
MKPSDRLAGYLSLLKIQQKAYQRNVFITGALLLAAFLSTTATMLFTEWNTRSIWLMGAFDTLFLLGFLMAWIRREIIREQIKLINTLLI